MSDSKNVNVNVTPKVSKSAAPVDVSKLRHAVAITAGKAYGAQKEYALALCKDGAGMPAMWWTIEHSDTSEAGKLVKAEKDALYKELKAQKHTNPSTIWARIRKYAQEAMTPKAPKSDGEGGEGEGESNGKRDTRSLNLRLVEDLIKLYKACKRADSLSDAEAKAHTYITSALTALGVDVAKLVAK